MGVFVAVLLVMWLVLRCRADAQATRGGRTGADTWLAMIFGAAASLLALHVALLYIVGTLSVWEVMGRITGDASVYFAAFVVERVKRELKTDKVSTTNAAAVLDAFAGAMSVAFTAIASTYGVVAAFQQLGEKPHRLHFDVYLTATHDLAMCIVSFM